MVHVRNEHNRRPRLAVVAHVSRLWAFIFHNHVAHPILFDTHAAQLVAKLRHEILHVLLMVRCCRQAQHALGKLQKFSSLHRAHYNEEASIGKRLYNPSLTADLPLASLTAP
jgi:hypothetical protein